MSDMDRLTDYISAAKKQQVADDFIAAMLRQQGWSDKRIYQAFTAYYDSALGQAIPSRGSRIEGAREAFLYLLSFITLGIWVVAFILLADQLIDHLLPNPVVTTYYSRSDIAGQLATLIVSFPLFLFVNRLIGNEVQRRPEALESGVRKWLTYIALVITAITLLGDAVFVITALLTGDLTARVALKAFILFAIAGGVFWYYLGAVRSDGATPGRDRAFGIGALVAVAALLAVGFAQSGSPMQQRALAVDSRRLSQLSHIAGEIHAYVTNAGSTPQPLPRTLAQLPTVTGTETKDPASGARYEYVPTTGTSYRLCATFDSSSNPDTVPAAWSHPAGRHCFEFDAEAAPVPYYNYN